MGSNEMNNVKAAIGGGMSWRIKQGIIIGLKNSSEKDVIIMDTQSEYKNGVTLGKMGECKKLNIFKKSEFKKELAPQNAEIEYYELNGKEYVKMTYQV